MYYVVLCLPETEHRAGGPLIVFETDGADQCRTHAAVVKSALDYTVVTDAEVCHGTFKAVGLYVHHYYQYDRFPGKRVMELADQIAKGGTWLKLVRS